VSRNGTEFRPQDWSTNTGGDANCVAARMSFGRLRAVMRLSGSLLQKLHLLLMEVIALCGMLWDCGDRWAVARSVFITPREDKDEGY
jgi:hypothetical protein